MHRTTLRSPRSRSARTRRRRRRRGALGALAVAWALGAVPAAHAVVFGQVDDFEDGTTMGWSHAAPSPNPPVNVATGGPHAPDDNWLRNISHGGFGAGSRHVVFNQVQWTGNFVTANVTRVTGFMANFGPGNLNMRVAMEGGMLNTRFCSINAIALPANSGWVPVTFDLTPSRMIIVAGSETLAEVLANVTTLRILSSPTPSYMGEVVLATLGIDDLRAQTLPGDANFDGRVNLNDFNTLAANFGTQTGATWQQADFNFDGNVNLNDFNLLAANFGSIVGAAAATPQDWASLGATVPEPGSLGLIASTGALTLRRVRRP